MDDYKELIDTLRDLTHGIVRISNGSVLREAADAIENQQTHIAALMHQLEMARGERDAVTKRMIKLEQEIRRVKGEPSV